MWHSSIYTWHIFLILGYFLHHGALSLYLRKVIIMYARQTPAHDKWTFKDQQLMNPFTHINNYRLISRIYNRMGNSMPYFYNSPILTIPRFWSTNRIYSWRPGAMVRYWVRYVVDWLVPLPRWYRANRNSDGVLSEKEIRPVTRGGDATNRRFGKGGYQCIHDISGSSDSSRYG